MVIKSKKKVLLGLFFILLLSSGLVYAATRYYAEQVRYHEDVQNPSNLLWAVFSTYAIGQFQSSPSCPSNSEFETYGSCCRHKPTGKLIAGWIIVNGTPVDATSITLKHGNKKDGCSGFWCILGSTASTEIFVNNFSRGSGPYLNITWYHVGKITTPDDAVQTTTIPISDSTVSGEMEQTLIARGCYSDSYADPRWYVTYFYD